MSNKKQNSIEWLINKCACADLRPELWNIIKEQAKAMHKEETCQFVSDYLDDAADHITAEEYYDQIYKNDIP